MRMRFIIEHGYRAVSCDDLERTFEIKWGFALLAIKVEGAEFHFAESAEEVEAGSLDVVLFGNFDEGGVDIGVVSQRAHEGAGAGGVNVLDGCSHRQLVDK